MKKVLMIVLMIVSMVFVSGCKAKGDAVDQEVDRAISDFLTSYRSFYVTEDGVSTDVLLALHHLDPKHKKGYIDSEVGTSMDIDYSSVYTLISILSYEKVTNKDLLRSIDAIDQLRSSVNDSWSAMPFLHILYMANATKDQIDPVKSLILETNLSFMDADFAGFAMLALAPYKDEEAVKIFLDSLKDLIKDNLSKDGVVSAWSGANSSSTAAVIIGLIAIGENPRDEDYQFEGIDLIEALLKYEKDGGFFWLLTDDEPDFMFSTPQAFAALVLYQRFFETRKPIYLYDVS